MTPHNAVGWSAWEEENLLPWLESNRDLTWKALSIAYWQQYHVRRSVESLRGKKHHILRKRRDAGKTLIVNESEASNFEEEKATEAFNQPMAQESATHQSDRSDYKVEKIIH
ncbi:hypothetical protein N7478_010244 [Penicillium angulare]|uniref:uncharacterized protein n=1 Tax=Penicillium angulare TaxID=116970 RepID=UPI002540829D|nr:uncharacterized protein N7478_010244 [Penicillium angulare]KAJ5267436.1 hypothetical protein N7478_010244 [Penicillium angulare]